MLKITNNFATPIAAMKLNDCGLINTSLVEYFRRLVVSEGSRNDIPTQPERDDLFESKFDLFDHDNAAVQKIKNFMHDGLKSLVMKLNSYPEAVRDTLNIKQHAWFHITKTNGYFTYHNHPMASWSAVYCVESGGRPDNYPESGITRVFHPNPNANYYMDAGNANMQAPFSTSSMNFALEAGDTIFFPSHLMHEVSIHKGIQDRITIAVNFWIESKFINVRI
ncbi:MAG: hypothetical protein ACI9N9_001281 [Enterobacterales bacterium]|jgi:uncharacterized protein (TIGR02466 family)